MCHLYMWLYPFLDLLTFSVHVHVCSFKRVQTIYHYHLKCMNLLSFFCSSALEVSAALGGPELEPFYSLIEGGRDGPFFAELEEFFYYAQIRRYMYSLCMMITILQVCLYLLVKGQTLWMVVKYHLVFH